MNEFINFINSLDGTSVFFGFVSCMIFDVFFSIANFFVQRSLLFSAKRRFYDNECVVYKSKEESKNG